MGERDAAGRERSSGGAGARVESIGPIAGCSARSETNGSDGAAARSGAATNGGRTPSRTRPVWPRVKFHRALHHVRGTGTLDGSGSTAAQPRRNPTAGNASLVCSVAGIVLMTSRDPPISRFRSSIRPRTCGLSLRSGAPSNERAASPCRSDLGVVDQLVGTSARGQRGGSRPAARVRGTAAVGRGGWDRAADAARPGWGRFAPASCSSSVPTPT